MSEYITHWNDPERIKAEAKVVQYFGLGFVQVKFSDTERMHFYHPDLHATVDEESAHTHRYPFTSQILKGVLEQRFFIENYNPATHIETFDSCKPDGSGISGFEDFKRPVCLSQLATIALNEGSFYSLDEDTIHAVRAIGRTVTHLTRPTKSSWFAKVYTPIGQPKVCPFGSKLTQDDLWEYIDDTING